MKRAMIKNITYDYDHCMARPELSTSVEQVFIRGRKVDMADKHRRLYERYQERYSRSKFPAPKTNTDKNGY
jgi:hypothetical protein